MKRALKITGVVTGLFLIPLLAAFMYYLGVTANVRLDANKLVTPSAYVRLYDASGEEIPAAVAATCAASAGLPVNSGVL